MEPLARGNRDAVAAILVATAFGDVVIHNHPSGPLTPSPADLDVASILGNQGVGFYIIDNEASRCYQAVSPFARVTLEHLSYSEIERLYAPAGILAAGLKGYEQREEQTRMAFAVAEAFNADKVAVIEAGTGTGKSLAYLIPAILWGVRNRERVVISTNTINLQEQLTKKDIPFLQKQGGLEFRAVLVKGRRNYLCLRKLAASRASPRCSRMKRQRRCRPSSTGAPGPRTAAAATSRSSRGMRPGKSSAARPTSAAGSNAPITPAAFSIRRAGKRPAPIS